MNDLTALKALCSLLMCDDPTNLAPEARASIERYANKQAREFGFGSWVEAYHWPDWPADSAQTKELAGLPVTPCSPSVFDAPPLHMDTLSRNARLYQTLLGMGLYVEPIKGPEGGISKFIVSCGLPS
jgi:hypothetical protein